MRGPNFGASAKCTPSTWRHGLPRPPLPRFPDVPNPARLRVIAVPRVKTHEPATRRGETRWSYFQFGVKNRGAWRDGAS
jgi:hypothetical protein